VNAEAYGHLFLLLQAAGVVALAVGVMVFLLVLV
jgi:hypothetical protein